MMCLRIKSAVTNSLRRLKHRCVDNFKTKYCFFIFLKTRLTDKSTGEGEMGGLGVGGREVRVGRGGARNQK